MVYTGNGAERRGKWGLVQVWVRGREGRGEGTRTIKKHIEQLPPH